MQTIRQWLTEPAELYLMPDDANPPMSYPAHLIGGTLPISGVPIALPTYDRSNTALAPNKTMIFGRAPGSVSNV